jgi:hypothetical protein
MHRMGSETAGFENSAGAARITYLEETLRRLLLGCRPELLRQGELKIQLHENTWTMVSLSSRGRTRALRLHRIFAWAPEPVLDAVVRSFFARENHSSMRALRARILDFVEANRGLAMAKLSTLRLLSSGGAVYDLSVVEQGVRRKYLPACPRVRIGWSQRATPSLMGKWVAMPDGERNVIVINRLLDNAGVPAFYLDYVVFHELLHEIIPVRRHAGRWVHHPSEFRRKEQQFPHFEEALSWERQHIGPLFKAYQRETRGQGPARETARESARAGALCAGPRPAALNRR